MRYVQGGKEERRQDQCVGGADSVSYVVFNPIITKRKGIKQ